MPQGYLVVGRITSEAQGLESMPSPKRGLEMLTSAGQHSEYEFKDEALEIIPSVS
jgi:hypothetical protein